MTDEWTVPADYDDCPRCGGKLEMRFVDDGDGNEIGAAERCRACRWVVSFDVEGDEEPTVRWY